MGGPERKEAGRNPSSVTRMVRGQNQPCPPSGGTGTNGWLAPVSSPPKLQTRSTGSGRPEEPGAGAPEGPDPLPFLPGQRPVVWPPKHASPGVLAQRPASGPGRSASPTTAPTCVAVPSCLSSGCSQLLTASQGTSQVVVVGGGGGSQKWAKVKVQGSA